MKLCLRAVVDPRSKSAEDGGKLLVVPVRRICQEHALLVKSIVEPRKASPNPAKMRQPNFGLTDATPALLPAMRSGIQESSQLKRIRVYAQSAPVAGHVRVMHSLLHQSLNPGGAGIGAKRR